MEPFMDLVQGRRSIRRYEERPIPRETLEAVLEAVRWSPSWANTQCWDIVVVEDAGIKAALQETIAPKNPATKAITAAPVVLAVCGRRERSGYYDGKVTTKFGDWLLFDLGLAAQTLCLAAHHFGLGTVIVGLFDQDRAARILNVPDTHELVTQIPMGYPAKVGKAPERPPVADFVRKNQF